MVKFMARTNGHRNGPQQQQQYQQQQNDGCCKNSNNKCWGCSENCGCGCDSFGGVLCTTTWLVAAAASLAGCAVSAIMWKRPEMLGYEKVGASADIQKVATLTKIETVTPVEEGMGCCGQFFLTCFILAILAAAAMFGNKKFTEEIKKLPAHATSMAQRYKAEESDYFSEDEEELRGTPSKNRRGKRSEALSEATSFDMFSDDESTQEARLYK